MYKVMSADAGAQKTPPTYRLTLNPHIVQSRVPPPVFQPIARQANGSAGFLYRDQNRYPSPG